MDFRILKSEVLSLISYNSAYNGAIPVMMNYYNDTGEFLHSEGQHVYIDPWEGTISMHNQTFKYYITDNTHDCSEIIVYLEKRA